MTHYSRWITVSLLLGAIATNACGQSLERRILTGSGEAVEFQLAARPGVCGDGRHWIRVDGDAWYGTMNDMTRSASCEAGPVRVVVYKSGTEVLRLATLVGPGSPEAGVTSLGRVTSGEALAFLGTLARTSDGRPARDALLSLGVADSMDAGAVFRDVATSPTRPRELRRGALSWLVRRSAGTGAEAATVTLLARMARDQEEHATFRQSVVGQLARLEGGVPVLIELASSDNDLLLARQAAEALARSGDPRARRAVRELVASEKVSADVRAAALGGMGSEYGTVQDAQAAIRAWPTMTTDKLRDAALGVVASTGGSEGRAFLLRLVRDESAASRQRRRAASLLDRAGVPVKDLIASYDMVSDGELRNQLIDALANAGTREATAKLVAIAKDDTQLNARRRAISALGRTDDPAVRSALQGIVTR